MSRVNLFFVRGRLYKRLRNGPIKVNCAYHAFCLYFNKDLLLTMSMESSPLA